MRLNTALDPVTGDDGDEYAAKTLQFKATTQEGIQQVEANMEGIIDRLFGRGVLIDSWTPDLVVAGTGLTLDIGAHIAVNGVVSVWAASVKVVPASSTVRVWEVQPEHGDTTPTYVTTATTDPDPSTADRPAFPLADVTTSGSAVTAVTEIFAVVDLASGSGGTPSPVTIAIQTEVFGPGLTGANDKDWDADPDDRTGGTGSIYDLELAHDISQVLGVYRGAGEDVRLRETTWEVVGTDTIRIHDGVKPVIGTDPAVNEFVTVQYIKV